MSIRVPQHSGKLPMRSTSILLEEHWEKRESSTTWYQLEIKGAGTGLPASSMEIVMDCVPDGSGTQSESTASSSFHLWCGASNLIWPGSTGAALARSIPVIPKQADRRTLLRFTLFLLQKETFRRNVQSVVKIQQLLCWNFWGWV